MEFGPVPLDQAQGAILAHSVAGLRKGTRIGDPELAVLRATRTGPVIVARLSAGDVHEDEAAARLAAALVPEQATQGLRLTQAATGRVNLYATGPGVLRLDRDAVRAVNRVNPMITFATLPAFARVSDGAMVGTVKIIAYGVPGADLTRAVAVADQAVSLARPLVRQATLIETTVDGAAPPPKGREAMRARLARLGVGLTERVIVPHAAEPLAAAVSDAAGGLVCILTASATSDPQDVGPAALRLAGGSVTRFGMPVDPGNLLFFGSLGAKPVIGLPGCARSPALNGADWVLERLICGVQVTSEDVADMGLGGLLKEIPTRPRPREG